mgnify:FL=1|jgi:hypothetical protein
MSRFQGRQVAAGTFVSMYVGGELVFDLKSIEAKFTIDKEDVIQNGTKSKDTKQVTVGGEGTFVTHHVYTRAKKLFDQFKAGKEIGYEDIIITLQDPDTNGIETWEIDRISLDEFSLIVSENASLVENETPFTFNPDDVTLKEVIARPAVSN